MPITARVTSEREREGRRDRLRHQLAETKVAEIDLPGFDVAEVWRTADGGWELRGDLRLLGLAATRHAVSLTALSEADAVSSAVSLLTARGLKEYGPAAEPPADTPAA